MTGDPVYFIYVILNVLDINEKGHDVKVIMEGFLIKAIMFVIKL